MLLKKIIGIFLIFSVVLSSAGCITRSLYQDDFYLEDVVSVLLSRDGEKLVFLSREYHYIFDLPIPLRKVLEDPELHEQVSAIFLNRKTTTWTVDDGSKTEKFDFYVDRLGNISGEVLLKVSQTAPEEIKIRAQSAGFEEREGGLTIKLTLKGIRYASNGVTLPPSYKQKLNKGAQYTVEVRESYNPTRAIALTPIAVVGDMVSISVGAAVAVVLVPIAIPIVTICVTSDESCSPLPMMVH
ncbi:MAG: hypothetical protein QM709_09830 [Spongiibacteraceae bacterium]